MKNIYTWSLAVFGFFTIEKSLGQDLDPRAYARVPVKVTVLVAGISYSDGGIVTDATLPLKDLNAQIGAPSLAVVRTFGLLGRTAQVSAALPYAWGKASATISGEQQSTTRSGIGDMRFRFSWLLLGAPAATLPEFAKVSTKDNIGPQRWPVSTHRSVFP